MANYNIDFTDPLFTAEQGFVVPDGTYDGPGNTESHTSLRLFGQGAPLWGESVNENFLRILENFASATPPMNPITGQLWYSAKLYWRNTTAGTTEEWFVFDPANTVSTGNPTWKLLENTNTVAAGKVLVGNGSPPTTAPIGSYFFDTATSQLFMWTSLYSQAEPAWVVRSYGANPLGLSNVVIGFNPPFDMQVYNAFSKSWSPVSQVPDSAVYVSPTPPSSPKVGQFWLNTLTGAYPAGLYLWDNVRWEAIAYLNIANEGRLSLTAVPNALNSVLTVKNKLVSGQGDNNTHFGYTAADGASVFNYIRGHKTIVDTPSTVFNGRVDANDFVTLHADPVSPMNAATKHYVDSLTSSSASGGVPPGSIILWSTASGPIPAGWAICDGTQGTPDMRNRFPIGAGLTYAAGTTGGGNTTSEAGSHDHTTSSSGDHNHSGNTGGYSLTSNDIPAHTHKYKSVINEGEYYGETARGNGNSELNGTYKGWYGSKWADTTSAGGGGGAAHSHSIPTSGAHTHTTSFAGNHSHAQSMPPFFAVFFIMKISGGGTTQPVLTLTPTSSAFTFDPNVQVLRTKVATISGEAWTEVSNVVSDPALNSILVQTDPATNEVYIVTAPGQTTSSQAGTYTRTVKWKGNTSNTEVQFVLTVTINSAVVTLPLQLSTTSYSRTVMPGAAANSDTVAGYSNELPAVVTSGLPAGMNYSFSNGSIILSGTYPTSNHSGVTTLRGTRTGTQVSLSHAFTVQTVFNIPNTSYSGTFDISTNAAMPATYTVQIGSFTGGPIASARVLPGGFGPWLSAPTITWDSGQSGNIYLYFYLTSSDAATTYSGTFEFTAASGQTDTVAYTLTTRQPVAPPPPPPPPPPPSQPLTFDLLAKESTGTAYATNPTGLGGGTFDVGNSGVNLVNMQIISFSANTGLGSGVNRYLEVGNISGQDAGSTITFTWTITSTTGDAANYSLMGSSGTTNRVMTVGNNVTALGAYRQATVSVVATTNTGQSFTRTFSIDTNLERTTTGGGANNPPNVNQMEP